MIKGICVGDLLSYRSYTGKRRYWVVQYIKCVEDRKRLYGYFSDEKEQAKILKDEHKRTQRGCIDLDSTNKDEIRIEEKSRISEWKGLL